MKAIIHAGLVVIGTVEVDTVTGKWELLAEPLVTADQFAQTECKDAKEIQRAGTLALAVLNQHVSQWVLRHAGVVVSGSEVRKDSEKPIPLVNIAPGKASA